MDTAKRIQLVTVIGKIKKNPEFSAKLGIQNKSVLKPEKEQKQISTVA